MPFDVSTFRSSLQLDGARPSQFEVFLPLPVEIGSAGIGSGTFGSTTADLRLRAFSSSLPGDTLSQISLNYFGRETKIAGTHSFGDWSFTVYQDEDFDLRNIFELWMNGMNGHISNLRQPNLISPGAYQRDARVIQYGKTGDIIKEYKLVGCFPTDLSPMDLDWGASDQIHQFAVTLAYQWWESLPSTDISSSTAPVSDLFNQ